MKKEKRLFGSENPNSFMLLGLINTLANKGILDKEERESIFDLGYYIEESSNLIDARKIKEKLDVLIENKE